MLHSHPLRCRACSRQPCARAHVRLPCCVLRRTTVLTRCMCCALRVCVQSVARCVARLLQGCAVCCSASRAADPVCALRIVRSLADRFRLRVVAQMWPSPGADVAGSWRRCGRVQAQMWPGRGADAAGSLRRCGRALRMRAMMRRRIKAVSTPRVSHVSVSTSGLCCDDAQAELDRPWAQSQPAQARLQNVRSHISAGNGLLDFFCTVVMCGTEDAENQPLHA
jgi:hypothetical protein